MPTDNRAEAARFLELVALVRAAGERDVLHLSRADVRLICRRGAEFWQQVEGGKPNTPADTSGPSQYM